MKTISNKPAERITAFYIRHKRRKGKPLELVGMTSGGGLSVICMMQEVAQRHKVPHSWVEIHVYGLKRKGKS